MPNGVEKGQYRSDNGRDAALQPAGRADTGQLTHDEAEIEAGGMNQEPLQDIRVTAQMRASHPTRVIEVGERAFDRLSASAHQTPAAATANPPTIAIHGPLGVGCIRPIPPAAVR